MSEGSCEPAPRWSLSGPAARSHPGGYVFEGDPGLTARDVPLFWEAAVDMNVICALASPCRSTEPGAFSLFELPWPAVLLQQPDRQELLVESPQGQTRLSLAAGDLLQGPVGLRYIIEGAALLERTHALQRWDWLLRKGAWPQSLERNSTPGERWSLLLATLDALARHRSLRETAIALFGEMTVEREWNQTSDHLKSRTRRLIAQARALAAGGYKALL